MKNLKLPLSDYKDIQKRLDKMRKKVDKDGVHKDLHNDLLYIGNVLFEATHNFDTGKPYLYK